jgi:hypothetical protein
MNLRKVRISQVPLPLPYQSFMPSIKEKILSIETGMSKEMPPSESTVTTTSPSSLVDCLISLT